MIRRLVLLLSFFFSTFFSSSLSLYQSIYPSLSAVWSLRMTCREWSISSWWTSTRRNGIRPTPSQEPMGSLAGPRPPRGGHTARPTGTGDSSPSSRRTESAPRNERWERTEREREKERRRRSGRAGERKDTQTQTQPKIVNAQAQLERGMREKKKER